MFGIPGWFLVGLVMGVVARLALRGRDPDGPAIILMIGVAGGLFGGLLGVATKIGDVGEPAAFLAALAGSVFALSLKALAVLRGSR